MTAATAGDVVAVLPGRLHREQVTLKQFVRLYSAAPSSTDSTVFTTSTGDAALDDHPRSVRGDGTGGHLRHGHRQRTSRASSGLDDRDRRLHDRQPALGDPASGTINPNAVGVDITNSNIMVDKDYFVDAGTGIAVTTSGSRRLTPADLQRRHHRQHRRRRHQRRGRDRRRRPAPVQVINDDFAFNTIGLVLDNTAATPLQAYVASNIFWQNHDQTNARNGFAIYSTNPEQGHAAEQPVLRQRRQRQHTQTHGHQRPGQRVQSALLGTTAAAAGVDQGNFVGNPAFVVPDRSPARLGWPGELLRRRRFRADRRLRPRSTTRGRRRPIPTDILGNSQVKIDGDGFGPARLRPARHRCLRVRRHRRQPVGGAFRVVTTLAGPGRRGTAGRRRHAGHRHVADVDHGHVLRERQPEQHQGDRSGALRLGGQPDRPGHTPPA